MRRALILHLALLGSAACASTPTGQRSFSVVEATIPDLQRALQEGRVTSRDLVEAYLLRIATYEEKLNATISVNPRALEVADSLDDAGAEVVDDRLFANPEASSEQSALHQRLAAAVACGSVPFHRQSAALRSRPPSRGKPGSRLKIPTIMLTRIRYATIAEGAQPILDRRRGEAHSHLDRPVEACFERGRLAPGDPDQRGPADDLIAAREFVDQLVARLAATPDTREVRAHGLAFE